MMRYVALFLLFSSLSFSQELTHKVYFKTDKHTINLIEKSKLNNFIKGLDTLTIKQITIFGFCDDRGSLNYNLNLSKKRANAVESFLKDNEVSKELIKVIDGKGEVNLTSISKNSIKNIRKNIRKNNRRVDLVVLTKYPKEEEKNPYEKPTTQQILKGEVKVGDKIRLKNIYFKTGFATIVPSSIKTLNEITKVLIERDDIYFTIEGHVCCTHDIHDAVDRKTNKRNLSHARARFIYNYMLKKGVKKNRMKFIGMKRKQPLGGKPKYDRRVEILITHIAKRD